MSAALLPVLVGEGEGVEYPTAVQEPGESHEMPVSWAVVAAIGIGRYLAVSFHWVRVAAPALATVTTSLVAVRADAAISSDTATLTIG
jgi:hypothetical protein